MSKELPNWAVEKILEQEFLRSQLTLTLPDYSAAVKRLSAVASGDTGAASACAQVLLSCYNDRNWQLNVMDLGSLDYRLTHDALLVMRGWLLLHEYPHNVIEDGEEIFAALEDQWQHLHVENRYSKFYESKQGET
tara:strand:+ start:2189 stop:2593 length:405 start_codon:yes stop_codon:yes gene_type:complete